MLFRLAQIHYVSRLTLSVYLVSGRPKGCQILWNWSCEQMVVSHYMCARNQTWVATRITGILNHWTVSLVPQFFFFSLFEMGFLCVAFTVLELAL